MKTIYQIMNVRLLALLFAAVIISSCSDDDDAAPDEENEVEVITNVNLIFTNTEDSSDVVMARAIDPDGEGTMELEILDPINLSASTTYTLSYDIENALDPEDVENIAEEIEEEDNEHQIFYSFTNDVFANPAGDGNIDNASDSVNYNDQDENGYNVGLSTTWTTSDTPSVGGTFTTRLQHQPDLKDGTTGANDGDTDFNLTFELNIE